MDTPRPSPRTNRTRRVKVVAGFLIRYHCRRHRAHFDRSADVIRTSLIEAKNSAGGAGPPAGGRGGRGGGGSAGAPPPRPGGGGGARPAQGPALRAAGRQGAWFQH